MNKTRTCSLLALAGCALLGGLAAAWSPSARSQINASPSWVPIGVSQSGSGSTAWFHEPGSRQAVACQSTSAPALAVQCVTVRLP